MVSPDINVNTNNNIGAKVWLFLTAPITKISTNSTINKRIKSEEGTYLEKYTPNTATIKDNENITNTLAKKLCCPMPLILS